MEATLPQSRRRATDIDPTAGELARWPLGKFVRWMVLVLVGAVAARGGDVSRLAVAVFSGNPPEAQVVIPRADIDALRARSDGNAVILDKHSQILSVMEGQLATYRRDVEELKLLAKEERAANDQRNAKLDRILGYLDAKGFGGR